MPPPHPRIYWLGSNKILKHAQFLCQFYELRKLNTHTGVEGCVVVTWFGQYTDIASLVSLFGFTQPILQYEPLFCVGLHMVPQLGLKRLYLFGTGDTFRDSVAVLVEVVQKRCSFGVNGNVESWRFGRNRWARSSTDPHRTLSSSQAELMLRGFQGRSDGSNLIYLLKIQECTKQFPIQSKVG